MAEVVDAGGDRAVWALDTPDARSWDTMGLLAFASELERRSIPPNDA